jgi:hypothetical protein
MSEVVSMQSFISPLSFVDEIGNVYIAEKVVYRAIHHDYEAQVMELLGCGLIDELVNKNLFPCTEISNIKIEGYDLILEHKKIDVVIYPYEWSPEMLRKAALCVLTVNEIAAGYGYELKDAHPYNVLFLFGNPVYIDFGSFVKKKNKKLWVAYQEFINCYINPLKLVENEFYTIYKHYFLLRESIDSRELVRVTSKFYALIPIRASRVLLKILRLYRNGPLLDEDLIRLEIKSGLLFQIIKKIMLNPRFPFRQKNTKSLIHCIKSLNLKSKSKWGSYHSDFGFYESDGRISLSNRMQWMLDRVENLAPKTVIELAGNQGVLARSIAKLPCVERVVCTDYDSRAVDELLLRINSDEKVFMACFDFMFDMKERISKERSNRLKSELVLALAVTHHLILAQKFTLDSIFSALSSFTSKYVIVEFMPLGLWDGSKAVSVPEWYNEQWFSDGFKKYFTIVEKKKLEDNRIAFIGRLIL